MAPRPEDNIETLRAALCLAAVPSRRRGLRNDPLPEGVALLLRIVADDREAIEAAAQRLQRPPIELREAAAFYIEQIMLNPQADSYRVLGAQPSATSAELRRNLALLCKWLHSDVCQDQGRSVFFTRITNAWNNLKTPERRAAYDAALDARLAAQRFSQEEGRRDVAKDERRKGKGKSAGGETSGAASRQPRIGTPRKRRRDSLWRRLIAFALGARRLGES
jgi:hypothetical protein